MLHMMKMALRTHEACLGRVPFLKYEIPLEITIRNSDEEVVDLIK